MPVALIAHTVLVVDDSRSVRKILGDAFTDAGYQTLTAADGAEALGMLDRHKVDLITLDAEMPVLDGFEACRLIRSNALTAAIPVVMLTSLKTPSEVRHGFEAGVSEYVGKPVRTDELVGLVDSYLRDDAQATDGVAALVSSAPASRLMASFALKQSGLKPEFFADGQAVLSSTTEHELVLFDEDTGSAAMRECMHELHRRRDNLPIVLLTYDHSPESLVSAYLQGASDVLIKPFETRVLAAKLRTLHQQKRIATIAQASGVRRARLALFQELNLALSHYLNNISTSLSLNLEYARSRTGHDAVVQRAFDSMSVDLDRIQQVLRKLERVGREPDVPIETYLNDLKMTKL